MTIASSKGQSSRQRMINLMYLVFIAMLAMNVSTEVLDGFDLVNDNLLHSIDVATERNKQIYAELEESYKKNPEKTERWYIDALEVKQQTDSLFEYIQSLKIDIAKFSDGSQADVNNLDNRENLDAATEIMMAVGKGQGTKLKEKIDVYRDQIISLITDSTKINLVKNGLSTEPTERAKKNKKNWVEASFENMPSIAVMTYLSELQSKIRQAEGEALSNLLRNIDFSDLRVNDVQAFVIPESNMVMQGATFKAKIVMAAVDTTQMPTIIVNGRTQNSSLFQELASGLGERTIKGSIALMNRDGNIVREFQQKYFVMEPMATIAPLLMDVLYAGINNPISISVPGVTAASVGASAEGGVLTRNGNTWIAKPTRVGGKFTITVSTNSGGTTRVVARKEFRIRALPDPTPYLETRDDKGNPKRFKRGAIPRSVILESSGLKAAIDDGILDLPFKVLGFRTVFVDAMGNAMQETSNGASFSDRQQNQIRRMERGRYFFISGIKVIGPDGIERETSPMEIRIN